MSDLAIVPGDARFAQFQLLRVRVERELRTASVIMVTSAASGDGKSLTAYGLAHALAAAGHRTALIDATQSPADAFRAPGAIQGQGRADLPVAIVMPTASGGHVREATAGLIESVRAGYDYAIVDCEPLLSDPVALALADVVDAVLLSIRVGRAPERDDKATIAMIEHYDARLLGIVAVTPESIEEYNDARTALPEGKRERALPGAATHAAAVGATHALPTPAQRS